MAQQVSNSSFSDMFSKAIAGCVLGTRVILSGSPFHYPEGCLCWPGQVGAVHGDRSSPDRSIPTSEMCQSCYVCGFIELIYSAAVAFNQGQVLHKLLADLRCGHWNGFGWNGIWYQRCSFVWSKYPVALPRSVAVTEPCCTLCPLVLNPLLFIHL